MKKATLYRMMNDEHHCPFGIKSKYLLEQEGYLVEDVILSSREEVDAFKRDHDVETTPQTFIDDKRIGGYEDLVSFFNKKTLKQKGTTYQPIIAIFSVTFLMAIAVSILSSHSINLIGILEHFIAISMCVLGIMKLRDLYNFSNQFITYDLLASKWVKYSYIYPFLETGAGILMLASILPWLSAPIAIVIGSIGCISVFKAVYIDKRDLKCACVGGDSSVPLGFISLTENIMMVLMGIWVLLNYII